MHLYCDRWCEICRSTALCEIYVPVATSHQKVLQLDFSDCVLTLKKLYKWASENNMAIEEIIAGSPADAERREKNKKNPRTNETSKIAADYRIESMNFKSKYKEKFNQFRQTSISKAELDSAISRTNEHKIMQAFEIIGWYELQMPLKITRAYLGEFECTDEEKKYLETNGSAKVVLSGIERSMPAGILSALIFLNWILNVKNSFFNLKESENGYWQTFQAAEFIRPGIDEVVTA